ncbi:sugar kinase [Candidatus Magnetomorum sp. HK-1]|nr:sugar kinase [Candidatus Magnetomorum sp. HK-1]
MLAIVGTIPDLNFPLTHGLVQWRGNQLRINNHNISINRGTPALLAAALKASETLNSHKIYAFLIGDTGKGEGSRNLYKFLTRHLTDFEFKSITYHYLQPDVDWHNKVLFAIEDMKSKPFLIADAGFMYAAKMSGQAHCYDFFTPDAGELAFLADELAPHPFYTRGFILHQNNKTPDLIKRAYKYQNAARYLLVKGNTDYIANADKIFDTVDQPSIEVMEAIGGTGDTLTALLTVLCSICKPVEAAILAAKTNRLSGYLANPNPATQVDELVDKIPQALTRILKENSTIHFDID